MEDLEQPLDPAPPEPQAPIQPALRITPEIRAYWLEIANWALVFSGLLTLYFIVSSISSLSDTSRYGEDLPKGFTLGAVLVGGALTMIPVWFYFKFANLTKEALRNDSNRALEEEFGFLKYHYAFYGILAIIYIAVIVFVFLLAIVFASTNSSF